MTSPSFANISHIISTFESVLLQIFYLGCRPRDRNWYDAKTFAVLRTQCRVRSLAGIALMMGRFLPLPPQSDNPWRSPDRPIVHYTYIQDTIHLLYTTLPRLDNSRQSTTAQGGQPTLCKTAVFFVHVMEGSFSASWFSRHQYQISNSIAYQLEATEPFHFPFKITDVGIIIVSYRKRHNLVRSS